jgi:hypothetical protein
LGHPQVVGPLLQMEVHPVFLLVWFHS